MKAAYLAVIEQAFLAHAGRGLMLSPRDVEQVARWARASVPAEVVIQGIESAFESKTDKVRSLAYVVPVVDSAIKAWRSRAVGGNTAPTSVVDVGPALDKLLTRIEARGRACEPDFREVFRSAWRGIHRLRALADSAQLADPVEGLAELSDRLCDEILACLTAVDAEQVKAAAQKEATVTSASAQAILWRELRERVNLPPLVIDLGGGW